MHNRAQLLRNVSDEHREELETRIDIIEHKLKYVTDKPLITIVKSLNPLSLAKVDASIVEFVGGRLVNPSICSWEELKEADPEIVLFAIEGLTIPQTLAKVFEETPLSILGGLFAAKSDRIYIANAEYFFKAEDGAALVDHLELMAEIINPKQFYFGFEGEGWIKLKI